MPNYDTLPSGAITHPRWGGPKDSIGGGGGGGDNGGMEQRVAALETNVKEIRAVLSRLEPMIVRIDATIPHLATKAEMEKTRSEMLVAIGDKPGKTYMWGIVGVLVATLMAGATVVTLLGN